MEEKIEFLLTNNELNTAISTLIQGLKNIPLNVVPKDAQKIMTDRLDKLLEIQEIRAINAGIMLDPKLGTQNHTSV